MRSLPHRLDRYPALGYWGRAAVRGEAAGRNPNLATGSDGIADAFNENIRGLLISLSSAILSSSFVFDSIVTKQ
ncbi:MAG TPA: hypothetical protein VG297_19090 [Bryobacteraceae bacterium]|nr:hypothetical protein [Bryobacteraceae bacterium]